MIFLEKLFLSKVAVLIFVLSVFVVPAMSSAEIFSSSNFKVLDPIISIGGERSTSTSFDLLQSFGELSIGTSTATNFQVSAGFLTFPVVTLPTVTATAGDGDVDLSWSASIGALGWSVSGYTIGQSTISGGPYAYTSVGNVISSTRAGLDNGTTYYFIVLPEDAFGNTIATSTEVNQTPVAAPPTPTSPSTGGGGPLFQRGAEVVFRGDAYPLGTATLLRGFQIIATTIVQQNGSFELLATGLSEGDHTFGITGVDTQGRRSRMLSFAVTATRDATVAVRNILLSPTLGADKSEVRKGDILHLEGESVPGEEVTLFIIFRGNGNGVFVGTALVTSNGTWGFSLDTSTFELGNYSIRAHVTKGDSISSLSPPVHATIGTRNIFAEPVVCPVKGDLNTDCRVNLVDFSIAVFFYLKPLDAVFREKEIELLSGDGVIDFIDFSLMAFYWTG